MPPTLFNIYLQILTEEALEKSRGLVGRGERIICSGGEIKYADDQAESEEELQCMMKCRSGQKNSK